MDKCKLCGDQIEAGDTHLFECVFCADVYHYECVELDEEAPIHGDPDASTFVCQTCEPKLQALTKKNTKQGLERVLRNVVPSTGWSLELPPQLRIHDALISEWTEGKAGLLSKGLNLYKERHVKHLQSAHRGCSSKYWFFKGLCEAQQKKNVYNIFSVFKVSEGALQESKIEWLFCDCPAGVNGDCKHSVAFLYSLSWFVNSGAASLEHYENSQATRGPTEQLQLWHVHRSVTDEPLLVAEINFIKHTPGKQKKRELGAAISRYKRKPTQYPPLSEAKIRRFVHGFEQACPNLPVLNTLRLNDCIPVQPTVAGNTSCEAFLIPKLWDSVAATPSALHKLLEERSNDLGCVLLYDIIKADQEEATRIEEKTRFQADSNLWFEERTYRLTASNFGVFLHLRASTDPVKTFLQRQEFFTSASVRHGRNNEEKAVSKLLEKNKDIQAQCAVGLVVNPFFFHLGASPDRLLDIDGELVCLEVKCPYTPYFRKVKLKTMFKDKNFYVSYNKETKEPELKKNHPYYAQVQGQMMATNTNRSLLAIYVPPDELEVLNVPRDEPFIVDMIEKLHTVYSDKLYPHFASTLNVD